VAPDWEHVLAAGLFVGRLAESQAPNVTMDSPGPASLPVRSDPAALYRVAVSSARLSNCGRPVIAAVGHALSGGVSESLLQLSRALRDRAEFLLLTPAENALIIESLNPDYAFSLAVDVETDYQCLLNVLRRCGVVRLHIHHTHGHRLDLNRLRCDLGVPFDFTAHDYYTICPQVHLNNPAGAYCGEPNEAGCNQCLTGRPTRPPRSIEAWRHEHAWLLREADRLIAPSTDTAHRLTRHVPDRDIIIASHPEFRVPRLFRDARVLADREPLRIAILGVLASHKGLRRVRECARLGSLRALPLRFTLIGHVDPRVRQRTEPFRQTGPYENASLPKLLTLIDPHVVWFPGESPETYSFTLSAALVAGLPVVVPNLGALPERVAELDWVWITPFDWDPEQMNIFFSQIRERNFVPHLSPPRPAGQYKPPSGFYESDYLEPVRVRKPT
jgi:glycosyltransferase involved in cell wall biosynthesis